jgi:gliding motility-associated-like protein
VYYEVCHVRHTETIQVYKEPTINFSIKDELKCAPYDAKFVNMSFADTEMFYAWDFGEDGATSSVRNPTYTYTDVGVYDVTLTVWTVDGCVDTLTLTRPGLVEVFPRPTSIFSIDPDVQDEYHADFLFTDASIDAVEIWYYFEDGSFSQEPIVWHNYTEPGVYYPYQIVKNEYGCTDKSYQKLTVIPVIPILVPNAFTPDGNAFNNVFKPVFYEPQVFQLFIYNRWGELVYAAHEYEASWNGTFNGNLVEDGVYLWKIIYTAYDTKIPVEVQGHVTVLK